MGELRVPFGVFLEGKRHAIADFGVSRYGFEFLVLLVDLGQATLNPFDLSESISFPQLEFSVPQGCCED